MRTIQALRTQLLQMEQRIKRIGGDLKRALWQLDELSVEETKELRRLLEQRKQLLDGMMQPTPAEVKRLELQNERCNSTGNFAPASTGLTASSSSSSKERHRLILSHAVRRVSSSTSTIHRTSKAPSRRCPKMTITGQTSRICFI